MAGKKKRDSALRTLRHSTWQLQTAKARFSEVFRLAFSNGPQRITRQGKDAVVVLPAAEFDRLMRQGRARRSLVRFFAESPLVDAGLDLDRKDDLGRDIDL